MKTALDGPIPGENFTSDTKNYPWHREPDHTEIDSAIEESVTKLTKKKPLIGLLTMLENGMTVAQAATAFVISGIGMGKWTPDFALLLVGPIAKVIETLAEAYGTEYTLGIDDDEPMPTKAVFTALRKINESKATEVAKDVVEEFSDSEDEVAPEDGGFMSPPSVGEEVAAEEVM